LRINRDHCFELLSLDPLNLVAYQMYHAVL
jgi:hypothetical protein